MSLLKFEHVLGELHIELGPVLRLFRFIIYLDLDLDCFFIKSCNQGCTKYE